MSDGAFRPSGRVRFDDIYARVCLDPPRICVWAREEVTREPEAGCSCINWILQSARPGFARSRDVGPSDRMARESSMSASGAGQRTRRARKKTFFLRPDVEADNPVASRREHALFADCEACDRVLGIAVGSQ